MRFLCIYKPSRPEGSAPNCEEMTEMGKLISDGFEKGWLLSTEGCLPSTFGARVRKAGEKITITDGPFAETRELVGGFALIQAASKDEAIDLTKRFLTIAGDGESEIRQVFEG